MVSVVRDARESSQQSQHEGDKHEEYLQAGILIERTNAGQVQLHGENQRERGYCWASKKLHGKGPNCYLVYVHCFKIKLTAVKTNA